jgi:hypothetical protein
MSNDTGTKLDPASATTFRFFAHNLGNPCLAEALRVKVGLTRKQLDDPISTSVLNDHLRDMLAPPSAKKG